MSADLDRVLLEIKDLRTDVVAVKTEITELEIEVENLIEGVRRTAYDTGASYVGNDTADALAGLVEIAAIVGEHQKFYRRMRDAVMARRNERNGCCDWSCSLCAPVAEFKGDDE